MEKDIAVVILNYNGKKYLEKFLPNVLEYSPGADVIVADNASTDGSSKFMKEHHSGVRLIELKDNTGYAGGYNNALKEVDHTYYVLLNSDVEVTPGWLQPMYELMQQNIKIAACQPKILAYNNKEQFEHAGASGGFLDKNAYPFCRGRIFDTLEKDRGQYDDTQQIFWATGACMMVRREYFWEAGGLDADFFAHMEEIDLSWRWAHMGYSSYAVPQSTVYHVGGGTLAYKNPKKTFLNFRNSLYMIYKNHPTHPMRASFIRMIYDGPAALLYLVKGQFKHVKAIWKAHRAFLKERPALKEKRRSIPHKKQVYGILPVNIILKHFLFRKKTYSSIWKKETPAS